MQLHGLVQAVQIVVAAIAFGTLASPDITASSVEEATKGTSPYRIRLAREQVPVRRKGKVVSFKTTYSGLMNVGFPIAQEFRVVFDTGSGQVVLPSTHCKSKTCSMHRRYDESSSEMALSVDADDLPSKENEPIDLLTIGYGSGEITGQFFRDQVCLGPAPKGEAHPEGSVKQVEGTEESHAPCVEMSIVAATEMSPQPFARFAFDGILGLGGAPLALGNSFSLFEMMVQKSKLAVPRFSFFLTDEDSEDMHSEIAIGGHNPERLLEPLSWVPVTHADLGHWKVEIQSIRIGGKTMSFCENGGCSGVLDSGSSHLGVPMPHDAEFARLLTIEADDGMTDCRHANAPLVEIELANFTITLHPEDYMRQLPLMEGVSVESIKGITTSQESATTTTSTILTENAGSLARHCRPRSMPVNLPAPLGPLLFILGEPVLHRYYSSFDWQEMKIGLGLSSNVRMRNAGTTNAEGDSDTDDFILLQLKTVITVRVRVRPSAAPRLLA